MAAADLTKVLRTPGKLALGATNLATAYPHGGTAIGVVDIVHVAPTMVTVPIREEAFGAEVIDYLYLGESYVCTVALRQYDDETLDTLFPNTAAGSSSGTSVVSHPGAVRAGTLMNTLGVVLTFTPNDTTNHPAWIARNAIPMIEETERLRQTVRRELVYPAMFAFIRPASGNAFDMGLIEDLSV